MGLIEIVGGLLLSKFAYDLQKPKPFEESAKYKAYDREYHGMLAGMDLWSGIEYQINQQLKFYDREKCNWYEASVYWKGDKNKPLRMNRITMWINQEYYASGLSMEEFVKQYFNKLKKQHKYDDPFWRVPFNESYYNIKLYDENGNPHFFYCSTID